VDAMMLEEKKRKGKRNETKIKQRQIKCNA
jgi:hypothetical protein